MIRESELNINGHSERPVVNTTSLARSILLVREGIYAAERKTNMAGPALDAYTSVVDNIPEYSHLSGVNNYSSRGYLHDPSDAILHRIGEMPGHEVYEVDGKLSSLLRVVYAAPSSLQDARRLQPYLPIKLPQTEVSYNILRSIIHTDKDQLGITVDERLVETLPQVEQILRRYDRAVVENIQGDIAIVEGARNAVRTIVNNSVDNIVDRNGDDVNNAREILAEQRIHELRRETVVLEGSNYIYSHYQILVNQILEQGIISQESDELQQLAESRKAEYRASVLPSVVRMRVREKAIQELKLAQILSQRAGVPATMSDQEITRAADRYIKNNRGRAIKIDLETARLEEEIKQLEALRSIGTSDEYALLAKQKMSDKEYAMLKPLIEGGKEAELVYKLGEEYLRKQIESSIPIEEIKEGIRQREEEREVKKLLLEVAAQAVDQAIASLGIEPNTVIQDPSLITSRSEEVISKAIQIVQASGVATRQNGNIEDNEIRDGKGEYPKWSTNYINKLRSNYQWKLVRPGSQEDGSNITAYYDAITPELLSKWRATREAIEVSIVAVTSDTQIHDLPARLLGYASSALNLSGLAIADWGVNIGALRIMSPCYINQYCDGGDLERKLDNAQKLQQLVSDYKERYYPHLDGLEVTLDVGNPIDQEVAERLKPKLEQIQVEHPALVAELNSVANRYTDEDTTTRTIEQSLLPLVYLLAHPEAWGYGDDEIVYSRNGVRRINYMPHSELRYLDYMSRIGNLWTYAEGHEITTMLARKYITAPYYLNGKTEPTLRELAEEKPEALLEDYKKRYKNTEAQESLQQLARDTARLSTPPLLGLLTDASTVVFSAR